MLYFVAKELLKPTRVYYRGRVYALLKENPPTKDPSEVIRNDAVPTDALDRIKWGEPHIEHEELVVKGNPVHAGRTTIEGQLWWRGKFVEPKIKLVFSWAYQIDPVTGRRRLIYTNLEEDSSHSLVDETGKPTKLDPLIFNYLQRAVGKPLSIVPSVTQTERAKSVPQKLHASRRRTAQPKLPPEYSIPVSAEDLDPEVILWFHSGQNDPVYALGSRLNAYGDTLASEEELNALINVVERIGYSADSSEEDQSRIDDLLYYAYQALKAPPREASAQPPKQLRFQGTLYVLAS